MDENKTYGTRLARLWKLFLSTLYISSFTFGGGFVIVTFMEKKFVDELHWIDEEEMLDLVAIAQSSPGPIAVNGAIVVGYKLAGMIGVLVSIIGTIIPPFLIISVISVCYQAFRDNFFVSQMLEGMQAGVGAVIASVTYEMGAGVVKEKDPLSLVILVCAFAAACFFRVSSGLPRGFAWFRLSSAQQLCQLCHGRDFSGPQVPEDLCPDVILPQVPGKAQG